MATKSQPAGGRSSHRRLRAGPKDAQLPGTVHAVRGHRLAIGSRHVDRVEHPRHDDIPVVVLHMDPAAEGGERGLVVLARDGDVHVALGELLLREQADFERVHGAVDEVEERGEDLERERVPALDGAQRAREVLQIAHVLLETGDGIAPAQGLAFGQARGVAFLQRRQGAHKLHHPRALD
eukprot:1251913-Pleurochrysis_carterae.AAC.4